MNEARVTVELERLVPWTPPKPVNTVKGPRDLRTFTLRNGKPEADAFWKVWRAAKKELKAAGITVKPVGAGDTWEAQWWMVPVERIARMQETVAKSHATDAEVEIPVPDGLAYLPYQRGGIAFALDRLRAGKGTLIGDEMGLGKTIQAIGVINGDAKIHRVLVICPATAKINWYRELRKWLTRKLSVGIADPGVFPTTDVVVINFDILHKFPKWMEFFWDLVVVDEAHYLRNPNARRTQIVVGYTPTKKMQKKGEKIVPPMNARRKLCLTGTPIPNKPVELWPLLNWLDKDTWGNFWRYAKRYCDARQNGFGYDFDGASNLDELKRELRSSVMVRRLKADVLTELPPKRRVIVELPPEGMEHLIGKEQRTLDEYETELEQHELRVELAKTQDEDSYRAAVDALRAAIKARFEQMSELRHDTAAAKIPLMLEHLDAVIEEHKVVFFAHHRDVLEAVQAHFGDRAVLLYGGMTERQKQSAVDSFQQDDHVRVFCGGIMAAGVAITLTAASHVVFGELDWVPGNISQAEDRCHRIGQKDNVYVEHLVVSGSLDSRMAEILVQKQEIIGRALDGSCDDLLGEPITLSGKTTVSFKEVERTARAIEETRVLRPQVVDDIHLALKILAGMCNGAVTRDQCGFNRMDTAIGKSLAMAGYLSPKQAALGARIVVKYVRQIGEALVNRIREGIGMKPIAPATGK